MRIRTAAATLVVLATMSVLAPIPAVSLECAEDGGTDCCGLDCALCLCCSHAPQTTLSVAADSSSGELRGSFGSELSALPLESFPQDILHVPRSRSRSLTDERTV